MRAHAGRPIFSAALLFLPFAFAFWFVFAALAGQWLDDPNYAHGLFVIPMAGVLAWRRRERYRAIPAEPSSAGLPVLLAGVMMYFAGILGAELFAMRVSLVVTFWGLFLVLEGRKRFAAMRFPLVFLLAMIPLPYVFYYKMTFPLQLLSTKFAASALSALGMPLVRMGNVIHLESYSLEVIAACSGLRSIMTLGTMTVFLSDFLALGAMARGAFFCFVIPVAIAANAVRLIATAILAALAGHAAADGFLHSASGVVVFLFGTVLLLVIGRVLEWSRK